MDKSSNRNNNTIYNSDTIIHATKIIKDLEGDLRIPDILKKVDKLLRAMEY